MQLTALVGETFCSEESGSDYWSVSINGSNASAKYTTFHSEFRKCKTSMPWLSGLQVVPFEEVGGCMRIMKKIDHVLLYCIVVILLKLAKRDTLGSVR